MNDLNFTQMQEMQRALQEKYIDKWGGLSPKIGRDQLLWMIIEAGEMADIIKKKGHDAIMENSHVRAHFVEETADVFMYLFDMMEAFGVSAEEFSEAYTAKFERNMGRSWEENKTKYED